MRLSFPSLSYSGRFFFLFFLREREKKHVEKRIFFFDGFDFIFVIVIILGLLSLI